MITILLALAVQQPLDETLRRLEKEIAAVRGLEFKQPVAARTIARPKDAARNVQGYYSTQDKTLYLYDDVSGAYERGVLVHEMVHALQDQHFGLAKLHQATFGSDAELALAALIEGDATFTMIELLKGEQPKVAAMLDQPIQKARNLQGAFLYAQGARYVRALRDKGGWDAVNAAYRNPPRATAQVLHPDGIAVVTLGPGRVRGEFELLRMLASKPETATEAARAAAGWRGDRFVEEGGTRAWILAFASEADARECRAAIARWRPLDNPGLESFLSEAGADAWRTSKGGVVAVLSRGDRVWSLEAPDEASFAALLDRLGGAAAAPAMAVWSARDKSFITFGQMVDRLLEADVVCVGETHDNELHHRVQLQVVKAIFACDESVGVGLEMFQRPFQKELDRYVAGQSTEAEFLKATEYASRWGFDWSLYRPIVEFCRRNGIPLAALNARKELTARISKVGVEGLSAEEKAELGEVDLGVKEHRDYWFERLGKMHGHRTPTPEQQERSYQVMTVWDEYMAASAAAFQAERRLRRMVVLAGSGHIDRGFGIPARTVKRTGGRVLTVHIAAGADPGKPPAETVADFTVIVR